MRKISWDEQALYYFRDAIQYIRKESPQNADKLKREVLEKIRELSNVLKFIARTNIRLIITGVTGLLSCTVYGWAIR